MNDTAKLAVTVATGMVLGKAASGSSGFWWLLGGLGALFIVNAPGARSAISSGARELYSNLRRN